MMRREEEMEFLVAWSSPGTSVFGRNGQTVGRFECRLAGRQLESSSPTLGWHSALGAGTPSPAFSAECLPLSFLPLTIVCIMANQRELGPEGHLDSSITGTVLTLTITLPTSQRTRAGICPSSWSCRDLGGLEGRVQGDQAVREGRMDAWNIIGSLWTSNMELFQSFNTQWWLKFCID